MTRLCIRVHVHAYAGRWMRSGMVQAFCAGLQRHGFVFFVEDGWMDSVMVVDGVGRGWILR
jgi:hypothetical protein